MSQSASARVSSENEYPFWLLRTEPVLLSVNCISLYEVVCVYHAWVILKPEMTVASQHHR